MTAKDKEKKTGQEESLEADPKTGPTAEGDDLAANLDEPQRPSGTDKADETEVKEPEDPISKLEAQVADLEDRLLREKANFANTQRRLANDRTEAIRFANADLMRALLPVIDDFERSLEAGPSAEDVKTVLEGTQLVYENLIKALQGQGLESIPATDQSFDPNVHEALLQQPSTEIEPGMVLEEIAKGYRLKGRVLRPSRVVVSKSPEEPAPDVANDEGVDTTA